jgi:hypothetical protein
MSKSLRAILKAAFPLAAVLCTSCTMDHGTSGEPVTVVSDSYEGIERPLPMHEKSDFGGTPASGTEAPLPSLTSTSSSDGIEDLLGKLNSAGLTSVHAKAKAPRSQTSPLPAPRVDVAQEDLSSVGASLSPMPASVPGLQPAEIRKIREKATHQGNHQQAEKSLPVKKAVATVPAPADGMVTSLSPMFVHRN